MRRIRPLAACVAAAIAFVGASPALGASVISDFNGDGKDDLAAGAPVDDIKGVNDAGSVSVLYGSKKGITSEGSQLWSKESRGVPGGVFEDAGFGGALTAGDFDGDGFDDLAIGAPRDPGVGADAETSGTVTVIRGSRDGLTKKGARSIRQSFSNFGEIPDNGDEFGAALAAGDFQGDGLDDLAIGVPGEQSVPSAAGHGAVNVIYGTQETSGLGTTGELWHQDTPGIGGGAEAGDAFGSALATGDLNADGTDDLAIGVPDEGVGSDAGAGAVNVIPGDDPVGLVTTGQEIFDEDSVPGSSSQPGDQFGAALATGTLGAGAATDLVVGAPGEDIAASASAGGMIVFAGVPQGALDKQNAVAIDQNTGGVKEDSEPNDRFGATIAAGDLGGDPLDELVVGVPGQNIESVTSQGEAHIFELDDLSLQPGDNLPLVQGVNGTPGTPASFGLFGQAVAVGRFDKGRVGDIAIAAGGAVVSGLERAGAIAALYSGGTDLTPERGTLWHRDRRGVAGKAGAFDELGDALVDSG